jgi:hypothetical protein
MSVSVSGGVEGMDWYAAPAWRVKLCLSAHRRLVVHTCRQVIRGQPFAFDDLGERPMKGFEQPVRVWSVRWS